MYSLEFYSGNGSFYQFSEQSMLEICHGNTGIVPAIIEDNLVVAVQPWNPNDEKAWTTKKAAKAWGDAWIESTKVEFSPSAKTVPDSNTLVPPAPEFAG